MLADPKDLLAIPQGDFRGAMYQPLIVYKLFYRRDVDRRQFPWVTTPHLEPLSHSDVVRYLKERYQVIAKRDWLETWEATALAWVRPIGPTAWFYIPISDRDSTCGGIGLKFDKDLCLAYWQEHLTSSDVELGPVFSDIARLILTTPFAKRKGGAELLQLLAPGDHIVFSTRPEGMLPMQDVKECWERLWQPQGVILHFANSRLDLSAPWGKRMLDIITVLTENQVDATSEQRLGVHERLRRTGRPSNGEPGLGWKLKGHGPNRRLVKDEPTRAIMREVYRQRNEEGRSYRQISEAIEKRICQVEGRPYKKSPFYPRRWTAQKCHRAYLAWKRILRDEYLLPVDEGADTVAGQ
jgi:hypothetical protein